MPSIYNVDPSDVETFTVVTHPIRTYSSSSTGGVTGSVYVFARRSHIEKDAGPDPSFVESRHDEAHIAETLRQAQWMGRTARYVPQSGSYASGSHASGSFTSGSHASGTFTTGSNIHVGGEFRFTYESYVIFSGSYTNLSGGLPNYTSGTTGLVFSGVLTGTYVPQSASSPFGTYYSFTDPNVPIVSGTAIFTGTLDGTGTLYELTGTFVPWSSGSVSSSLQYFSASVLYEVGGTYIPTGTYTPTGTYVPEGTYTGSGEWTPTGQFYSILQQYMDKVESKAMSRRKRHALNVNRFSPPLTFNSNTMRKLVVKDILQQFYRTSYPAAHWAYTNYNTLNFFTSSTVPESTVLLYPNIDGGNGGLVYHEGYCSGTYTPSGSFSFDFYINPRYQPDAPNGEFKAGTILHLSSTFALSLISGSSKDVNGRPVGFRLQLQLSHSADITPSEAVPGTFATKQDLVFLSNDNVLWHNRWHHVVVRWGTRDINGGLGTFNVDGVDVGTFLVPSATITPRLFPTNSLQGQPDVLCVGNFYEGSNHSGSHQSLFFAHDPALRDGLNELDPQTGVDRPTAYEFRHPLNAELHDVAIRRCYMSNTDIAYSASVGPTYLDNTFAFYCPPFFVEQSPYRQFVGGRGGILVTPFQEIDGATLTPFGVGLSFGVGGHLINLENFVRDFASNVFPMLHDLTASAMTGSTTALSCNEFLYAQPAVVKRNLTILPCDDGLFVPSYQLLASETLTRAIDDLGLEELSFINIDNMVKTSSMLFAGDTGLASTDIDADGDGIADSVQAQFSKLQIGLTPETPFASAGPALSASIRNAVSGSDIESSLPLTVYQRTQDASSNQVTFFDISNLFYGFRIKPGTLFLQDPFMSSSGGAVKMTLADDGRGNVYRADCYTSQSSWNSVGNIYYDEGIIVLKSPHVYFFGNEQYDLCFRGEQHVHVMKLDVLAPNNQLNSSSNPNFIAVPVNNFPNDPERDFVYITNVNFHDRDYNVVLKSQLAQPIAKRAGDRILFKVKYDW